MATPKSRTVIALWTIAAAVVIAIVAWLLWSPPAVMPQESVEDEIGVTD